MSFIPDQAKRLHAIMRKVRPQDNKPKKKCRVICVTSGKGGVGKTSFTINYAIALGKCGKRVAILDADFGFSNVDIMLGANSRFNMSHVLNGQRQLEEIMEQCFANVWHISGGAGLADLVNVNQQKLKAAMGQLKNLEERMDFILIDTGAGINPNVLRMIDSSDTTVLVMTSEPTSIIDSYVVLKTASELEDMPVITTLINRAQSEKDAVFTHDSFSKVVAKHLDRPVDMLGFLPQDQRMTGSISSLTPHIMKYPKSAFSVKLQNIATATAGQPPQGKGAESRGFFERLFR